MNRPHMYCPHVAAVKKLCRSALVLWYTFIDMSDTLYDPDALNIAALCHAQLCAAHAYHMRLMRCCDQSTPQLAPQLIHYRLDSSEETINKDKMCYLGLVTGPVLQQRCTRGS